MEHGANADLAAALVATPDLAEADLLIFGQVVIVQQQVVEFVVAHQVINPVC